MDDCFRGWLVQLSSQGHQGVRHGKDATIRVLEFFGGESGVSRVVIPQLEPGDFRPRDRFDIIIFGDGGAPADAVTERLIDAGEGDGERFGRRGLPVYRCGRRDLAESLQRLGAIG